jgi:PKD repeat protein
MKFISFSHKLLIILVLAITAITSCKKTEIVTINIQQPTARFTVLVTDFFDGFQTQRTTAVIDSNFYFRNNSDFGDSITYHWDFGDGTTSTEKNPKHSYAKRGTYKVTLIVSNDNKAFDTLQQTLRVILGQQHIGFGEGTKVSPVAIEETATNEFMLLAVKDNGTSYLLIQLDSLLKQKSMKIFPSNYRLTSMKSTDDGNYIFTGSTQATDKGNELIKLKADGTQLWSKSLSTNDHYTYATPTPDGGFAVVGSRPVPAPFGNTTYNTVITKTDNNGNTTWQKLLNMEGMIQSRNALIEPDGIVVSGVKRDVTSSCWNCDSLLIIKLDNTGNVVWKNTVLWGLNTSNWGSTHIAKLANSNYVVTNQGTKGLFFFSPAGQFLDRKLAPSHITGLTNADNGDLVILQSEGGNGFRIGITQMNLDGARQWYAYPDGRLKVPGGYSCCSTSWPVAIKSLQKGGTITIGYRVNDNTTGNDYHTNIILLELDEAGNFK